MAMSGVIVAAGLRFRGGRVFSGTHQPSPIGLETYTLWGYIAVCEKTSRLPVKNA
jgi:hypothetical protein